jgi:hypothetical protein
MNTWIEVNGARVEKEFFDANVREAKGYDWVEIRAADLVEHVHCMICGVTIDPQSSPAIRAYKSKGGYVCSYCYDHYLK